MNAQNILIDTGKACKIAFPHSSDLDGFVIWVPSKLVRSGSHSYEYSVSLHRDMTFKAKKYGHGKWNRNQVIEEMDIDQEDIFEAFSGSGTETAHNAMKKDVIEVTTHTPERLEPVHTEADPELMR